MAPEENHGFWAPKAAGWEAGSGCLQGRLSQKPSHLGGTGCPGTREVAAQGHRVLGAGLPLWDLLAPPTLLSICPPLCACVTALSQDPAEAPAAGRELGWQVKKASWKRRDSGGV